MLAVLKSLSLVGYLGMVGGLVGMAVTHNLFSPNLAVIAVQVSALALMVWARVTFGCRSYHLAADPTSGGVVRSGPYRYIRHPIYTAMCLVALAGVAAHQNLTAAAWAGLV